MYIKNITVNVNGGLMTKFVQKANEFDCYIWVEKGSAKISAKTLLGMTAMELGCGDSITISADGKDEQQAVEALCALLA